MDDVARALARAAQGHLDEAWTSERAGRLERSLLRRAQRRKRARAATLAAAVLVGLSGGAWIARRALPKGAVASTHGAPLPLPLRLSDGSRATPLGPDSVLEAAPRADGVVVVRVLRGGARFEVTHTPTRIFRVEAGDVAVQVLGTVFSVERDADGGASVAVEAGRVRVSWGARFADLGAGERGRFPRDELAAGAPASGQDPPPGPTAEQAPEPPRAVGPAASGRPAAARADWRALAQSGDFARAYDLLRQARPDAARDEPRDLLLAADVARFSNHPAEALAPLRRVVAEHARDLRAPLAAFTLGRVLLAQLGRPRDAAEAFAQARALAPAGSLAEDALAHEVEAWSRAGDPVRARERAEEYQRRYPSGRWTALVRAFSSGG